MRSRSPPWPGSIPPESLTPALRLYADSRRSPTCPAMFAAAAMASRCTGGALSHRVKARAASSDPAKLPTAPSQVFPGLRCGASATHAVEPHSTRPTTNGIKMTAVATRFQVMEKESPPNCAKKVNRVLWSAAVLPPLYRLKQPLKKFHLQDLIARRRAPVFQNPVRLRECRRSAARASEIPRKPRAAARD